MWKSNNFVVKGLSNRVTINLYMFQALVINRVGIDLDGVGVVINTVGIHVESRIQQFPNLRDGCYIRTSDNNIVHINKEDDYPVRCLLLK